MSGRWSVQNRPKHPAALTAALYGFLTTTTLLGGFVTAIAADQVRKWRNERRLAKGTTR